MILLNRRMRSGESRAAAFWDGELVDLEALIGTGAGVTSLTEAIASEAIMDRLRSLSKAPRSEPPDVALLPGYGSEWKVLPPSTRPSKVIGVGGNSRAFLDGVGEDIPSVPAFFNKTASALAGYGDAIQVPASTRSPVPEAELALVLGRRCYDVAPEEAMDFVAGFTCVNDVAARNLEFETSQWTGGKMLPTFAPLGPWLRTRGEPLDLSATAVVLRVNGVEWQRGTLDDLVFGPAALISELSRRVLLEPGDVVLCGTPSDLGAVDPPMYLTDGCEVEVSVSGVGTLRNPVVFS